MLHGVGTVLYVGMGGYGVPTTGNAPWSRDCTMRGYGVPILHGQYGAECIWT